MDKAYRADLWDVAYAINGGCSDDGFVYFRWWLVMQGEDILEAALENPESLAEISAATRDLEHEGYGYSRRESLSSRDREEGHFPTTFTPSAAGRAADLDCAAARQRATGAFGESFRCCGGCCTTRR